MLTRLGRSIQSITGVIAPQRHCCGCQQPYTGSGRLCPYCLEALKPEPVSRCRRCGITLAEGELCGRCITAPPDFDCTWVLDDYQWPLSQMIGQLKYSRQPQWAYALAELFVREHPEIPVPDLLTWVPMHWRKQWKRGFNQSQKLCQALSKQYHCCCQPLFIRKKAGRDLIGLTARARLRTLQGCYQLIDSHALLPEHVTLVDDVMTTNSTASILAAQLKQAGVERVDIWVIARTPLTVPNHSP